MAAGVPDELFWQLTLDELRAYLEAVVDRDRKADMRAATICATIANVNRRKGQPAIKATDFLARAPQHMSVEEAEKFMDRWAKRQTKDLARGSTPPRKGQKKAP